MKFCDEKIQKHLLNGGKIKRESYDFMIFLSSNNESLCYPWGCTYCLIKEDLTADDWKIVEPEYDWDKIIKDKVLCVFSDTDDFKTFVISTLAKIEGNGFSFKTNEELSYGYCKPFNPAEFNIAKDLREYEK